MNPEVITAERLRNLPWDQPSALRRGKISPSGRYHYCTTCGRWGGFGYHCGTSKEEWYCDEHRPDKPDLLSRLRQTGITAPRHGGKDGDLNRWARKQMAEHKFWGGFVHGKLHTWTETWTQALGHREYRHTRCAIFTSRAQARREYTDVRPIIIEFPESLT